MSLEGLALAVGVLVTPELAPTQHGLYKIAAAGWRPGGRKKEDGAVIVAAAVYKTGVERGREERRRGETRGRNKDERRKEEKEEKEAG